MLHLADFLRAHGAYIRRITPEGVLAACPATQDGRPCSELSPALSTLADARKWLGY